MTNFLPAGIITDRIIELYDLVCRLEEKLDPESDKTHEEIAKLKCSAQELVELMQSFSCQPLIYTGKGTTEEVIDRLEWILTFSDINEQSVPAKPKRRQKKSIQNR